MIAASMIMTTKKMKFVRLFVRCMATLRKGMGFRTSADLKRALQNLDKELEKWNLGKTGKI